MSPAPSTWRRSRRRRGRDEANLADAAVKKSRAASDEHLDELYREHPEGFVAGRDQLVKDLRAAGDREEADRVKKLRRPTVAAWLLNRAALTSPAELEEFSEASRQLEDAQGRALEGKDEGATAWRDAAAREREATGSGASDRPRRSAPLRSARRRSARPGPRSGETWHRRAGSSSAWRGSSPTRRRAKSGPVPAWTRPWKRCAARRRSSRTASGRRRLSG